MFIYSLSALGLAKIIKELKNKELAQKYLLKIKEDLTKIDIIKKCFALEGIYVIYKAFKEDNDILSLIESIPLDKYAKEDISTYRRCLPLLYYLGAIKPEINPYLNDEIIKEIEEDINELPKLFSLLVGKLDTYDILENLIHAKYLFNAFYFAPEYWDSYKPAIFDMLNHRFWAVEHVGINLIRVLINNYNLELSERDIRLLRRNFYSNPVISVRLEYLMLFNELLNKKLPNNIREQIIRTVYYGYVKDVSWEVKKICKSILNAHNVEVIEYNNDINTLKFMLNNYIYRLGAFAIIKKLIERGEINDEVLSIIPICKDVGIILPSLCKLNSRKAEEIIEKAKLNKNILHHLTYRLIRELKEFIAIVRLEATDEIIYLQKKDIQVESIYPHVKFNFIFEEWDKLRENLKIILLNINDTESRTLLNELEEIEKSGLKYTSFQRIFDENVDWVELFFILKYLPCEYYPIIEKYQIDKIFDIAQPYDKLFLKVVLINFLINLYDTNEKFIEYVEENSKYLFDLIVKYWEESDVLKDISFKLFLKLTYNKVALGDFLIRGLKLNSDTTIKIIKQILNSNKINAILNCMEVLVESFKYFPSKNLEVFKEDVLRLKETTKHPYLRKLCNDFIFYLE
jgi:hypothetical protein